MLNLMPKILLRIVPFLLIPCLLVDPVLAHALPGPRAWVGDRIDRQTFSFQEQALSASYSGARFLKPFHIISTVTVILGVAGNLFGQTDIGTSTSDSGILHWLRD